MAFRINPLGASPNAGRAGVLIPAALFGIAMIWLIVAGTPKLDRRIADGDFSNPCCGTLELRAGQMRYKGSQVPYVIETDKVGAYVVPDDYVGVLDGRSIEIRRNSGGLILRLDSASDPKSITVGNEGSGNSEYVFTRTETVEPN